MKENFKSGFTAIIGRPNVGKSTLMNHLIGQKIAITSKKPQTTRNRIQTVYTCEDGQIVFLDTPGIHKAKNKLGEYMVQVAERTLKDVDVILWLVEPTTFIGAGERHIAEQLKGLHLPVLSDHGAQPLANVVDVILQPIDAFELLLDADDQIGRQMTLLLCLGDFCLDHLKQLVVPHGHGNAELGQDASQGIGLHDAHLHHLTAHAVH